MGRYRFRGEGALADAAMEVEGRDLTDLFQTAAQGLVALMVDPATVPLALERTLTLTAARPDLLLYDWLSELIFRKDRDQEVFPGVEARVTGNGVWRVEARLRGAAIDPRHTARRADPKAVTFHEFVVEPAEAGWRAHLVIDT